MKKFKIQISNRFVYDKEDEKKIREIVKELKKMEGQYSEVVKESERAKEKYWLVSEEVRKGNVLNFSTARKQELRAKLWAAESGVTGPLKSHSERWHGLCEEAGALTCELRAEIRGYLEGYISEIESIKTVQELSRDPNFDVEIQVTQNNLEACENVASRLRDFKGRVLAMTTESFGDIVEAVKAFENEVNGIDLFEFEREEVTRPLKSAKPRI